jgi:hypothetical protein
MQPLSILSKVLLSGFAIASLAASATASPITVTRGPNGAVTIVNSDRIPLGAKVAPQTEPHAFPKLITRGPGGTGHIVGTATPESMNTAQDSKSLHLVTRGPHGAGFLTDK